MGTLRIIGGKWRSRHINLPDKITAIRPTPNAVRETLFNWLQENIVDAICLDVFAGSGALSFEALSRGAKLVIATEQNKKNVALLKKTAATLGANEKTFIALYAHIPQDLVLLQSQPKFSIVFLDPPFRHNLIVKTARQLEILNLLDKQALIYIEAEKELCLTEKNSLPNTWQILRHKISGQEQYLLLKRTPTIHAAELTTHHT